MEKKSLAIAEEQRQEAERAKLEQDKLMDQQEIFVPPTEAELQRERDQGVEMSAIATRIETIVRVLGDFKRLRYENTTRARYLEIFQGDLSYYYGYLPYLISQFLLLFGPGECVEYLEANETQRPVTIRVNTLKSRRKDVASALVARGVNLDPIEWSKSGLQVFDSTIPIGATPEYLGGHYMIQSASSWTPVVALAPRPHERVLDMAAAPGGKTTHIAALMRNTGELIANDASRERLKALTANVHRMGVKNCIVTNYDGREIYKHMGGFDRVLLDAPCTGLGVVAKDPSVKVSRDKEDIDKLSFLQKQLILTAIDAVDAQSPTGGIIVYSTCSVSVEENEAVVNYALSKRHVKLIDTGLTFGKPGMVKHMGKKFNDTLRLTRRYYPHVFNMDGFYVAKLKKISNVIPGQEGIAIPVRINHNTKQPESGGTDRVPKKKIVDSMMMEDDWEVVLSGLKSKKTTDSSSPASKKKTVSSTKKTSTRSTAAPTKTKNKNTSKTKTTSTSPAAPATAPSKKRTSSRKKDATAATSKPPTKKAPAKRKRKAEPVSEPPAKRLRRTSSRTKK
eukprot:TRINITY_DN3294_c0_g1_i1.p1 TRINITY_DN3294_c0_g1~~TRINITY_DN3294_c0_g1_i1.p1  ORF type:complete len:646 (+),score=171.88 TRINITY_DN3294_c0_g1_i1:248-1939(+)